MAPGYQIQLGLSVGAVAGYYLFKNYILPQTQEKEFDVEVLARAVELAKQAAEEGGSGCESAKERAKDD